MVNLPLLDKNGKEAGAFNASDALFGVKVKPAVIWQVEHWFMASLRGGNASTKTRAEVRGGGKKPWQQKGTGRARAGSSRSPLWRGGGVIFGPKPRKYGYSLPKKVRQLAVAGVLSDKAAGNKIRVLQAIDIKEGKTREAAKLLKLLSLEGKILLLIDEENQALIRRAGANIKNLEVLNCGELNIHSLLDADWLVATEQAFKTLEGKLN